MTTGEIVRAWRRVKDATAETGFLALHSTGEAYIHSKDRDPLPASDVYTVEEWERFVAMGVWEELDVNQLKSDTVPTVAEKRFAQETEEMTRTEKLFYLKGLQYALAVTQLGIEATEDVLSRLVNFAQEIDGLSELKKKAYLKGLEYAAKAIEFDTEVGINVINAVLEAGQKAMELVDGNQN